MKKENEDKVPDKDQFVYVPDDLYCAFHNAFYMMEKAQKELHQLREELKTVER